MTSRAAATALSLGIAATSLFGIAPASAQAPTPPKTHLTLTVTGCEGCQLQLTQAVDGRRKVWQSRPKIVTDGSVSWRVPTKRTRGLSITVTAPWDGGAGYVPVVAFRYAGERPGDRVDNGLARTKKRASACWAGTSEGRVTLPVTVVHARSTSPAGERIRTPRAFTTVTQRWEQPMLRTWQGIAGTQDAIWCR